MFGVVCPCAYVYLYKGRSGEGCTLTLGAKPCSGTRQALGPDGSALPGGTELLRLVPPRWNDQGQMFQLSYEGRACCMSNKNVQLADTSRPEEAALQVGKLRNNMFNVDMSGCVSPFQAFAAALAVFDQSSVRRRF